MATIQIELEPGECVTVINNSIVEWEEDPDPGEEKPEEEKPTLIRAVGQ